MTDAWDGRPQNPERDWPHWFKTPTGFITLRWCVWPILKQPLWKLSHETYLSPEELIERYSWEYHGPCLTPTEVEMRELDAEQRDAEVSEAIHRAVERTRREAMVEVEVREKVLLAEIERYQRALGTANATIMGMQDGALLRDLQAELERSKARERAAELRGREEERAAVTVQIDTAIEHERQKLDRELYGFAQAIEVLAQRVDKPELTMLAVRRLQIDLMQRMQVADNQDVHAMRADLAGRIENGGA